MIERQPSAEEDDLKIIMRRRRLAAMAGLTAVYLFLRHPLGPPLMVMLPINVQ